MLAELIIQRYHLANWIEISSRLFMYEQSKAVEAAKKFLPIQFQREAVIIFFPHNIYAAISPPSERRLEESLTVENMCHSLNKEKWYHLAYGINIPNSKRKEIRQKFDNDPDQCSRAAWKFWLENHPAPSWARIVDGLFQIGEVENLKQIEREYPSGLFIVVTTL